MRKGIRVVLFSLLGLLSTAVLGAFTALMAAVSLAASTALIVPGPGTPDANEVEFYLPNFRDYYMQETTCTEAANCELEGVNYFASFWPIPLPGWCDPGRCEKFDDSVEDGVQNLKLALEALQDLDPDTDDHLVIAGYSQGARVVSIAKTKIASGEWAHLIDEMESVQFVFIGNPNRPNGGILSRFGFLGRIPILDVTTGQPTPTDTEFPTEDWAIRWEGIADFPQYLFNPLAVANSLLGFYYDHGTYLAINEDSDPGELPAGYDVDLWREITAHPEEFPGVVQKTTYGDTTYYTITPKVLPLVRPLHSIPFIGKPIADLFEPLLRLIIEETGYNRDIPYGQYSPIGLFPIFNPITLAFKMIPAIFTGINNFLANFGLATEIPLTDTTRVPVQPEEEEPESAELLNDTDGSFDAKLAPAPDDGDIKLLVDGEKNVVALTQDGSDPTPAEGNESPLVEEVADSGELQGTGLDESPATTPEIVPEKKTDLGTGIDVVSGTKPEAEEETGGNTIDADGRSVSLNFSTNKPPEGPTEGGQGAVQPAPTEGQEPEVDDGEDPAGAGDPQGSEPAAA